MLDQLQSWLPGTSRTVRQRGIVIRVARGCRFRQLHEGNSLTTRKRNLHSVLVAKRLARVNATACYVHTILGTKHGRLPWLSSTMICGRP